MMGVIFEGKREIKVPNQFRKPRDQVSYLAGYEQGFKDGMDEGAIVSLGFQADKPVAPAETFLRRVQLGAAEVWFKFWPLWFAAVVFVMIAVLVFSCCGCTEQRRSFYDGDESTTHHCANGRCWRVISPGEGQGEYMGDGGELLPAPRDAEAAR